MQRSWVVGALFLLGAGLADAALFRDIDRSPYKDAILELEERGIVEGFADGTYRPESPINRAEFLNILLQTEFPGQSPEDLRCFHDLEVNTPQWYARPVCLAQELGIVSGYPDGFFRPDHSVNLVEALKMTMRTFGIAPPESMGPEWYEPYIVEAQSRRILLPLLSDPAHRLTRGEMASLTYAFVQESEKKTPPPLNQVCGNGVLEAPEQCDDRNLEDGDGCSSICLLVPEPVRRSVLHIDQQTTGTLSVVARGQQDVTLLKFTGVSGRQDVLLTGLKFQTSIGSLQYAKNYELAMDRDRNGTYETMVGAQGTADQSTLTFEKFENKGVLLPEGLIVPFIVRADVVSTMGPVTLGIQFKTSDPAFVEAQGAIDSLMLEGIETNSVCTAPNCFIRVNTAGDLNINIEERGTLFVTQDTFPVRAHILLGGTKTDALLRLTLRAEGEEIDIVSIRIDGGTSSVDSLLLYKLPQGQSFTPGALEPFAQATNGQCPDFTATRFCATMPFSSLTVPSGEEVSVVVAALMKTDTQGGVSGETMTLSLQSATNASFSVQARGVASKETLEQNDGDGTAEGEVIIGHVLPVPNSTVTGKTFDSALATIRSIENAGPAAENFIPTGAHPFAAFKFFASPHTNAQGGLNEVLLKALIFEVSAQNVQIDPLSYRLSALGDPATTTPCSATSTTGSIQVTCSGLQTATIQNRIGQGQSLTLRLTGTITNSQLNPGSSSLRTSLLTLGQRGIANAVEWSDGVTTFVWVDTVQTSVDGTLWRR